MLASAVDPKFDGLIHSAYIDIIKQLEVVDVHLLNAVYESYHQWLEERLRKGKEAGGGYYSSRNHKVYKNDVIERLGINSSVYDDLD